MCRLSSLDRAAHLGVDVKRVRKTPRGVGRIPEQRVDLAEQEVDVELVWSLKNQLLQRGQCDLSGEAGCQLDHPRLETERRRLRIHLDSSHRCKGFGSSETDHRTVRVDDVGLLVDVQCFVFLTSSLEDLQEQRTNWVRRETCASRCDDGATYLADAAEKDSVLLVDLDRASEAVLGVSKLVLAQIGRPETVPAAARGGSGQTTIILARCGSEDAPSVEVTLLDPNCGLEERKRPVVLLHAHRLVSAERVRVGVARVQLTRSSEAAHGFVVLLLQREAVAEGNPRLGSSAGDGEEILREVRESDIVVQVPQESREDVHGLETVRIERACLSERSLGLDDEKEASDQGDNVSTARDEP